jgi:hypothetical protein
MKPMIIKGMPTGAEITNNVKTNPTIINTTPKMAATYRPVRLRIKANKSHSATKGHKYQGVLLSVFSGMEFSFIDFFTIYIYEKYSLMSRILQNTWILWNIYNIVGQS